MNAWPGDPASWRAEGRAGLRLVPALILLAAVTFNAVLAIVNGVRPLSTAIVIVAELGIVGAAHLVALANYRPEMKPWYVLIGLLTLVTLLKSLAADALDVKSLRDVILIPTFIVLGMTFDARGLNRLVVGLHVIVVAVLLLEAFALPAYSALFKIQDYYINTRGYVAEDFWNKESDLYVSATRPDDRVLLPSLNLHRLSSIFLEPVSLGNYFIIITAYLCARFRTLGGGAKAFLILGNLAVLIGCDSRLGMASAFLIVAAAVVAPRLPRRSVVLYLPLVTAVAFALAGFSGFRVGTDDLPGRIAHTVELLKRYDVEDLLGLTDRYMPLAVDSGLAYLVMTQTIFGLIAIWGFITLAGDEDEPSQIRYLHALGIYLSLTMMVSFSLLSIKTAALLWFIQGVLQRRGAPAAITVPWNLGAALGAPVHARS